METEEMVNQPLPRSEDVTVHLCWIFIIRSIGPQRVSNDPPPWIERYNCVAPLRIPLFTLYPSVYDSASVKFRN